MTTQQDFSGFFLIRVFVHGEVFFKLWALVVEREVLGVESVDGVDDEREEVEEGVDAHAEGLGFGTAEKNWVACQQTDKVISFKLVYLIRQMTSKMLKDGSLKFAKVVITGYSGFPLILSNSMYSKTRLLSFGASRRQPNREKGLIDLSQSCGTQR